MSTERNAPAPLSACDEPLAGRYDVALLDLDGVVYVGPDPVPDAPENLRKAAKEGMRIGYITNNASRPAAGRRRASRLVRAGCDRRRRGDVRAGGREADRERVPEGVARCSWSAARG